MASSSTTQHPLPSSTFSNSTSLNNIQLPEHLREFIAGTVSGWAQVVVGHPFDTIKVRLQTSNTYGGALDCLGKTIRGEGLSGLFKGVNSPLMGIGLCNAVLFSANENFRRLMQDGDPNKVLSLSEMTVAGALSGVVIAFVLCPVELVKVRLQVQRTSLKASASSTLPISMQPYSGVLDCASRIYQTKGISGLYRGFNLTILREVPSFAAYFGVYEGIKEILAKRHPDNNQHPRTLDLLLAGGLAGQVAWITCYPQDVLKSRMQASDKYKSSLQVTQILWRDVGWKGFWKGFGTTMIRAFPANAVTFLAYEQCIRFLHPSR